MINLPNIPQGIFGPDMSELSYGCKGPAVALLQQVLNFHMPFTPPPLAVDGIFGPKTKARTREFQELGEVAIDGIVGPQTARKICSYVESRFHLLVVPRRVAKKPVANDAAEARRQRPGRVASQPGDARFGTGTIGVMGLPQRSPFPQSAEQVVQLAPISQLIKQDRKDRNRRLMLNFKNHLRLGAGAFGGANLSYSFKTRAMEPTAFLATDLTLAMGLGWKEKFAAEIGGGFAYQLSVRFKTS
jgi:Putative peptidoglycan binding domain